MRKWLLEPGSKSEVDQEYQKSFYPLYQRSQGTSGFKSRNDQISPASSPKAPRGFRAPSVRFGPNRSRLARNTPSTKAFDPITAPSVKYRTRQATTFEIFKSRASSSESLSNSASAFLRLIPFRTTTLRFVCTFPRSSPCSMPAEIKIFRYSFPTPPCDQLRPETSRVPNEYIARTNPS